MWSLLAPPSAPTLYRWSTVDSKIRRLRTTTCNVVGGPRWRGTLAPWRAGVEACLDVLRKGVRARRAVRAEGGADFPNYRAAHVEVLGKVGPQHMVCLLNRDTCGIHARIYSSIPEVPKCPIPSSFFLFLFYFIFLSFEGHTMAYGGSQARGLIVAVAAGLCQCHSNARSELHLQPTPQLMAMPDP